MPAEVKDEVTALRYREPLLSKATEGLCNSYFLQAPNKGTLKKAYRKALPVIVNSVLHGIPLM
jgi:hypothetical protein